jgi:hypothetical protein
VNISNPSAMVDFIIFIKIGESKMIVKTEVHDRSKFKRPNIIIKVYQEEPDMPMPVTDEDWEEHYKLDCHIQGKYSYEVYREGDEHPFFSDTHDIWDIENALNLAHQDFSDEWECDND